MTIKYECNRCGKQTNNPDDMLEVVTRRNTKWGLEERVVRHFCSFCSLMMLNAISIVVDGTYTGSLNPDDKIGKLTEEQRSADPVYNGGKKYDNKTD